MIPCSAWLDFKCSFLNQHHFSVLRKCEHFYTLPKFVQNCIYTNIPYVCLLTVQYFNAFIDECIVCKGPGARIAWNAWHAACHSDVGPHGPRMCPTPGCYHPIPWKTSPPMKFMLVVGLIVVPINAPQLFLLESVCSSIFYFLHVWCE